MRIGLYGGRFDPPHFGHLLLAETAREALGLEAVWFLPARDPPHKPATASASARAAMTELAVRDHPAFEVDRAELERAGPSYAVDTVEAKRAAHPRTRFAYLLGEDAYRDLPNWHRAETLAAQAELVVVARPDAGGDDPPEPFRSTATYLEGIPFNVSSTLVRARARAHRSLRYLVPETVAAYLRTHALYADRPPEGAAP